MMAKCIKCIRDLFEYALYKLTLYLLTYFTYCYNIGRHGAGHPLGEGTFGR